jgi:hypothetical protein
MNTVNATLFVFVFEPSSGNIEEYRRIPRIGEKDDSISYYYYELLSLHVNKHELNWIINIIIIVYCNWVAPGGSSLTPVHTSMELYK